MSSKIFDDFQEMFHDESEFIDSIRDMENNSEWLPEIPRKELQVIPLDGPMFVADAVAKCGVDHDTAHDTAVNDLHGGYGTNLMVQYQGTTWCLRDTGRATLYTTAGLIGPANANMVKAEGFADLAQCLNIALRYAKGNGLLLLRYGKLSALHSGASDGYAIMRISELVRITKEKLNNRFGVPKFKEGFNSHSYTSAVWELPDVRDDLIDKYQKALSNAVSRNHAVNWMPVVRLSTSDTATSSAILMPKLMSPGGAFSFAIGKGIRVEHKKLAAGKYGLEKFEDEADGLYALFEDGAAMMQKMGSMEISNPVNCLVGICSYLKIPRKYADPAREEVDTFVINSPRMSALDIYLSMAQIPTYAKHAGASDAKVLELEELIGKTLNLNWSDYDIGGTVAWK